MGMKRDEVRTFVNETALTAAVTALKNAEGTEPIVNVELLGSPHKRSVEQLVTVWPTTGGPRKFRVRVSEIY